ncbi:hypothetical protein FA13DRAFT_1733077, partial [Coprinellus micaceus]
MLRGTLVAPKYLTLPFCAPLGFLSRGWLAAYLRHPWTSKHKSTASTHGCRLAEGTSRSHVASEYMSESDQDGRQVAAIHYPSPGPTRRHSKPSHYTELYPALPNPNTLKVEGSCWSSQYGDLDGTFLSRLCRWIEIRFFPVLPAEGVLVAS